MLSGLQHHPLVAVSADRNGRNRCNVSLNLDNPKSLWIYKKYYKVIMICLCTSCIKYRNDSGNLVHYRWNSRCLCVSTLWNHRPNRMFPLFGSATICRSFSCIRWSSQSLQTIFGMNGMRIVLNLQVLEKTIQGISGYIFHYSTDAEYIHINHHSIHWPPKCTTYTHNCTGSRLTWTFFATNYHEFAIFGCGYLRETKKHVRYI